MEGLYQNPHRLSLYGKIIIFNCKRAPATNDTKTSEVAFSSLSFKREDNAFLESSNGAAVIGGKRCSRVDVVTCERVIHVQKRVTTPCVLVTKRKGENFQYSLLTLSGSNQLEPCIEFKLPYQMRESVSILGGPTVVWSHAGNVFYTSLEAGEVRRIPVQLSHSVAADLPLHKGFVLGQQNLSDQCPSNLSTSQTVGCFLQDGRVFDGALMLPHPYICITRCISVLSAEKVDADGVLKSAVVAATSQRQLVYFENGVVRDTCQLPFEQPQTIQVANTGRNGCLFVIFFHQGHVCAVWKETFQVASSWSDVSSVHVDDFLGCGSDQMLLVFKDHGVAGRPLERFLLTDLCGISYARCQDDGAPKTSPPPTENYLLTLQALESRLQSGLSVLQELQREVRVKDRVLQHALHALTDVSEREATFMQPEQEGLIALVDCDDESKEEAGADVRTRDAPAVSSKPHVDKLWHRFAEDRLVVGVILTTESSAPVASVSLSILTEMSQSSAPAVIQTHSQVFWLPVPSCSSSSSSSSSYSSASLFPEPAAKRSKRHNDLNTCRLAVTAATGLTPLLNSGCVKCRVVLHYAQRRDASALASNPTPVVLHCGEVALDVRGDFQTRLLKNPELKTDEVKEDLLSLMALLDGWLFHMDSPDHSLGDVRGWIQTRVGCKRVEVSPQCLLLDSPAPMLLRWHQITPFQGELSVHSSQLQMLQFLDSLSAYLPASCSIRPVRASRGQGAAQIFSLALEEEAASLKECVSTLLCQDAEGEEKMKSPGHEETPRLASVAGLQRCRDAWQQDVEKSKRRLSPLVDVERYRRLTQSMFNVQLQGDLAALLLDTRRTLLS